MRLLQASVPKSGSYWLWMVLQHVLNLGGLPQKSFIRSHPIHRLARTWDLSYPEQADIDVVQIIFGRFFFRIDGVFRMPIEDLEDYLAATSYVWTHSPYGPASPLFLARFDKIVYLIRDPRDMAVSMSRFVFTPYARKYYPHQYSDPDAYLADQLENLLREWVEHVQGYLQSRSAWPMHVVFYERLRHAFEAELGGLAAHLEVDLPPSAAEEVRQATAFARMKLRSPSHVRQGESCQWAACLTSRQQQLALAVAGPLLESLHYPLTVGPGTTALPFLSECPGDRL